MLRAPQERVLREADEAFAASDTWQKQAVMLVALPVAAIVGAAVLAPDAVVPVAILALGLLVTVAPRVREATHARFVAERLPPEARRAWETTRRTEGTGARRVARALDAALVALILAFVLFATAAPELAGLAIMALGVLAAPATYLRARAHATRVLAVADAGGATPRMREQAEWELRAATRLAPVAAVLLVLAGVLLERF